MPSGSGAALPAYRSLSTPETYNAFLWHSPLGFRTNHLVRTLIVIVLAPLVSSAGGWAKHSEIVQRIPFTLYQNHLVVAVGSLGGLEQKHLLIDTGTNVCMVDTATAHELGLEKVGQRIGGMSVIDGVAQIYYSVLPTMDLGPIHRGSMPVAVSNLAWLHDKAGVRIDAVIGLDALAPLNFQIDYETRTLNFGAIRVPRSAVPVVKTDGLLMVQAQVNGAPVNLMVDTGGSSLVLFAESLPKSVTSQTLQATSELTNLAGHTDLRKLNIKTFSIGETSLNDSTALIAGSPVCCHLQGILGISAMQFRRIDFDFGRGMVGFELSDPNAFVPFGTATHGVILVPQQPTRLR